MTRLLPLAVALWAVLAFLPALQGEFLSWDDRTNIELNQEFRGLGPANLRWMFTTRLLGHYQPLTWLTFAADYLVWGMDPFGYHLTNLLFHAGSALILFFAARRLLGAARRHDRGPPHPDAYTAYAAAFAALVFAVHPMRVESVAWITERRDVLSTFFVLLTVLFYLRHADGGRRSDYGLSLAFYCAALLSKSIAAMLPPALLVLDVYPLRRATFLKPAALKEKLPFFALALAAVVLAFDAMNRGDRFVSLSEHGAWERLLQSAYGLCYYLFRFIAPAGLSPHYGIPVPFDPLAPLFVAALVLTALGAAALWRFRRRWPALPAAAVCYALFLLPVLGPFQNGMQLVADRYSYLSCLGWALVAAGLWESLARRRPKACLAGGLLLAVVMSAATWSYCGAWRSSESVWQRAVEKAYPPSPTAHYNLACELDGRGSDDQALAHYLEALRLDWREGSAHYNLSRLLMRRGRLTAAELHLREAARLMPRHPGVCNNLGVLLAELGRYDEAETWMRRSLELAPEQEGARHNLERLRKLRRRRP